MVEIIDSVMWSLFIGQAESTLQIVGYNIVNIQWRTQFHRGSKTEKKLNGDFGKLGLISLPKWAIGDHTGMLLLNKIVLKKVPKS